MSAPDLERLSPDEQRARDGVRSLAPPRADAGYRARLEREFVSGALAEAPAKPRPARRIIPLFWVAVPAAAAAGALIVFVSLNSGPSWEVLSGRGEGIVRIDGVAVAINRAAELERRLKPGARLQTPPGGEIEIMLPGQVALQIAPGTDVTLPPSAGRWFGRNARARVAGGEVRITTGARFHGARLAVETPEATVQVTGTTLAVICEPTGTCVCVLEGHVMVAARSEHPGVQVTEGRRRYVFNDARPPEMADIRGNEIGSLREFKEQRRPLMDR